MSRVSARKNRLLRAISKIYYIMYNVCQLPLYKFNIVTNKLNITYAVVKLQLTTVLNLATIYYRY